jgi:hypothetical protein
LVSDLSLATGLATRQAIQGVTFESEKPEQTFLSLGLTFHD